MKISALIPLLMVGLCIPSHAEDGASPPEPAKASDHASYKIPINEEAKEALSLILRNDGCTFKHYMRACGVRITEGDVCIPDTKDNTVQIVLDHENSAKVVMILGAIMGEMFTDSLSPEQLALRYTNSSDSSVGCAWPESTKSKKENKAEMATPRKPSD